MRKHFVSEHFRCKRFLEVTAKAVSALNIRVVLGQTIGFENFHEASERGRGQLTSLSEAAGGRGGASAFHPPELQSDCLVRKQFSKRPLQSSGADV